MEDEAISVFKKEINFTNKVSDIIRKFYWHEGEYELISLIEYKKNDSVKNLEYNFGSFTISSDVVKDFEFNAFTLADFVTFNKSDFKLHTLPCKINKPTKL